MLERKINNSKLRLLKDDLTMMDIEAIVFYAQPNLQLGAGFGNAITVRGGASIQEELNGFGRCSTGDVVITGAGQLKCSFIIHAIGPRFLETGMEEKLRTTIKNCLVSAESKKIRKIAFPPMGTGFYGIPLDVSAEVMLDTITEHLSGETKIEEIAICAMDNREFNAFQDKMGSPSLI